MAVTKGILAPKIAVAGMPGFLLWARRDQPEMYLALVRQFPVINRFEEMYKNEVDPGAGLGGFMDILSSIGGGLAKTASSVGSFIATNGPALFTAAGSVIVANQQSKVAGLQLQLAQIQQPPAQVAYVNGPNGTKVPVAVKPTGAGGYASYSAGGGGILSTLQNVSMTTCTAYSVSICAHS